MSKQDLKIAEETSKKSSELIAKKDFHLCAGKYDKTRKKHAVNIKIKTGDVLRSEEIPAALMKNLKTEGVI